RDYLRTWTCSTPRARGDVDLVHLVPVAVGFAEDRAMATFERDPRDKKLKLFRMTAERDGNCVADRDPRRQTDVAVRFAGAGNKPVAALGQLAWAAGLDGCDII